MKTIFLFLCTGCIPFYSFAQTAYRTLDINNIDATISNKASIFNDGSSGRFNVPRTQQGSLSKSTIYSSAPWMGGLANGQLFLAAETYRQQGRDMQQGPVVPVYSAQHLAYWDRIWKINRTTLETFKSKVQTQQDVSGSEYTDILEWPAKGNVFGGDTVTHYAPFVDVNNNHIYEPLQGDYPIIRGDQCLFTIINDDVLHTETQSSRLKMEVHRMAYAYATDDVLNNTVFVDYKVINKSTQTYESFIFSSWVDFDLGNYADDYVGTDSLRNMIYAFNGDANDDGLTGYGTTPPAQACVFLNQPLANTMYYNNTFSATGNISTPEDAYNYMKGIWKDGSPKTASDSGYQTSGDPTNYFFGGDPCTGTGWWEGASGNQPGDRRMLASMAPQSFFPDQEINLTLGFVYARAGSGDNIASVCALKQAVDSVQEWFNKQPPVGMKETARQLQFSVYPNPARESFSIRGVDAKLFNVSVTDITGRMIKQMTAKPQETIQTNDLKPGMYFVTVTTGNQTAVKRLVIE
jgi:hypothetical protein